ncbi:hypothetical protein BZM27_34805 [Paraburkholderia steynii]|uniref:Uncharacterized protein n=1 Tax=Paraburkholderia steynii TaxID=1245441 RepID=A0A4R0X5Q7_9BURK|nr:hypothetical protein BZM27_34805 [Paraburkholderia steynii]
MSTSKTRFNEAVALERVANAARDVQAACIALQYHFRPDGNAHPSMPQFVRFEAAMLELQVARAEFDAAYNCEPTWQESRADMHLLRG